MNKHEENKLTMYKSVHSLLNANTAKTGTIPALTDSVTEFRNLLQEIESTAIRLGQAITGKTGAKYQAENELIAALMPVGAAMVALGRKLKNPELQAKADIRESYLQRMRDTELVTKAKAIHALALENEANLVAYGITTTKLDELSDKIGNYDASLGGLESSGAVRSGARVSLSNLYGKMDDLLDNDLDRQIELLRGAHPQFYNEYFATRVIKDLGTGRGGTTEPTPPPTPPPTPTP